MRWMTRRELLGSGLGGFMAIPWLSSPNALAEPADLNVERRKQEMNGEPNPDARTEQTGLTDSEVILGVSAAFSGPSRGLGI